MEWNKRFSVVVASKLLTLFDIEKRSLLWTIHVEQFFQESITEAIKVSFFCYFCEAKIAD